MDLRNKNYYDILEIPVSASQDDIQRAFMRAKNAYSGDSAALYSLMSEHESKEILDQVEEAYSILGVPEKRKQYDKNRNLGDFAKVKELPSWARNNVALQEAQVNKAEVHSFPASEKFAQESLGEKDFQLKQNHKEQEFSKISALKKYQLSFERDPDFEREIEQQREFDGPFLRKIREYKNVSLERMAEMTRVSKNYLRGIEAEEWTNLPAAVYVRGFIFQYAKCLKLNPDFVATSFLHQLKKGKAQAG